MRDWLKESETEAAIGISTFLGFAVRLDKTEPAGTSVTELLENGDDTAVISLLRNEPVLLNRLDEEGHDLVIHEVAKVLIPGLPETEEFLKQPEFHLALQDRELNSSLHYLADAGVDVLGAVPFKLLLLRNRNGVTPLHFLAKHKQFHERLLALPDPVLHLATRNGATIAGVVNSYVKPDPTLLQELGQE